MIPETRALLIVISAILFLATWMSRHDTVQASNLAAFVPDQRTNVVYYCGVGMYECVTSKR